MLKSNCDVDCLKIKAPATAANLGAGFDVFVFNVGSASMMVIGILRNDIGLIGKSMQNHVIEPARAGLIPRYLDVRNSALRAGATGMAISGSGPAMIAVCGMDKREEVASAMVNAFAKNRIDSTVFITTVGRGVEVLE